jgi:F0F1-type ATP synthase assembly protein I
MEEPKKKLPGITSLEAIGITAEIIATILVLTTLFALGGVMADRHFGTKFVFTVIGFLLLVAVGYRVILKKARRIARRLEGENTDNGV